MSFIVEDVGEGYELTSSVLKTFERVKTIRKERLSEPSRTHRVGTALMPSVEMRRTTRVFGARVLRSGRRLFTTQGELKHMRRAPLAAAGAEEDWIELLNHGGRGGGDVEFKENGWHNLNEESEDEAMDIDDGEPQKEIKLGKSREVDLVEHGHDDSDHLTGNSRWGVVYSRKRKRSLSADRCSSDRRFGKKFVRKQARKAIMNEELPSMIENLHPYVPTERKKSSRLALKYKSRSKKGKKVSVSKPTGMNPTSMQLRNGVTVHHGTQQRRSSLKLRKQRNSSSFGHRKSSGGIVQDGVPFFPIKRKAEISKSIQRPSYKVLKSTIVELTQDIDSASCSANILVIESDRCCRETGAIVTMEMSLTKQWFLIVKREGVERFRLEAKNVMRPCFCNRVTHAIIWAGGDESWKLEFPNRQDWFIFKELYRKCAEWSVRERVSLASVIPVPRVSEVLGYVEEEYVPFKMPDSYISLRGDEVARALEKSDPIYEIDSDDEEWLNRFNGEHDSQVDEDTFEKIIDAFERGMYQSPEDYSDVTLAVDRCGMLASKDVLEATYGHWMAKRKKKHSALVLVFQFYKPKRTEQLNIKAVLRKKRSFRQRGSQAGRGKQLTFLKAVLCEEAEGAATAIKVEEAEAAAKRAEQAAAEKRQRAQLLMEVADLLTYKAAMALGIAEARGSVDDDTFTQELFSG